MKILVAVEMKHPDSPILVTQVHMDTPKTDSDRTRAAMAFLELQEQVIEQSVKVTKYQVAGKHKKLKSVRCPHCKFNYSKLQHAQFLNLEAALKDSPDKYQYVLCSACKEFYGVRKWGHFWEMEW